MIDDDDCSNPHATAFDVSACLLSPCRASPPLPSPPLQAISAAARRYGVGAGAGHLAPIPEGWPSHPNTGPNTPSRRATRRIGLPALGTLMRQNRTHLHSQLLLLLRLCRLAPSCLRQLPHLVLCTWCFWAAARWPLNYSITIYGLRHSSGASRDVARKQVSPALLLSNNNYQLSIG